MSVSTSGSPLAAASIAERGSPSRQDGSTNTSISAISSGTSSRHPVKTTSLAARSIWPAVTASGLSGSRSPTARNRAFGTRARTSRAASKSSA